MDKNSYLTSSRRYTQLPRFFRWFSNQCVVRQLDDSDIARVWRTVQSRGFARCCSAAAPSTNAEVVEALRVAQADWLRGTRYSLAVLQKRSHDFVGWVDVAPLPTVKQAWTLDAFIDPGFFGSPLALEAVGAAADLLFSALSAQVLYARCPRGNPRLEDILNSQGFIEVAAAGTRDPITGRERQHAQYELGLRDWQALHRAQVTLRSTEDQITAQWITTGAKVELTLV
jgi:RimJ/RimL family protein N-acetyltransferase